jgi:hypothetical protein
MTWYTGKLQSICQSWTLNEVPHDSLLYKMKEYLKLGTGVCGWKVRYSSDGSTAGTPDDEIDRWTDEESLTSLAWAVFKSAAGIEICIQKGAKAGGWGQYRYKMGFIMSISAGFTGGTATTRPTATDEVVVCEHNTGGTANTRYAEIAGALGFGLIHTSTTDGKNLIFVIVKYGTVVGFLGVGELDQIRASDTRGYVAYKAGKNAQAVDLANNTYWNLSPGHECTYPSIYSQNDRDSNTKKYFKAMMRSYSGSAVHEMVFASPYFGQRLNSGPPWSYYTYLHDGFGGVPESDILVASYRDENSPEDMLIRGRLVGLRRVAGIIPGTVYMDFNSAYRLCIGQLSIPWKEDTALMV